MNESRVNLSELRNQPQFKIFKEHLLKCSKIFLDTSEEDFLTGLSQSESELNALKFLGDSQEMILMVIKKDEEDGKCKVICELNLDMIHQNCGEVIAFFKNQDLDLKAVRQERNYLKNTLNVLNLGEITENFDILSVFQETLNQGILPILQEYKIRQHLGEDSDKISSDQKEYQKFNTIFKKFNELHGQIQQKTRVKDELKLDIEIDGQVKELIEKNGGQELDVSEVPQDLITNKDFIQNLSEQKLKWESQVSVLMNHGKDMKIKSVTDEISFWMNLCKSLDNLKLQLDQPGVQLTQKILRAKSLPWEIYQQEEFNNLKKNAENIKQIMTSLNFDQILVSLQKDENNMDIKDFFSNIKKLVEKNFYPTARIKLFLQVLNQEYIQMLAKLVKNRKIFEMDNKNAQELIKSIIIFPIFTWDHQLDRIKEIFRLKRKKDIIKNTDISIKGKKLQERIEKIKNIKQEHEDLRQLYIETFEAKKFQKSEFFELNFPTLKDLEEIFNVFYPLDPLDLSEEGYQKLNEAEFQYLQKTTELDKKIVENIHKMNQKKLTDNEKFQIFCRFSKIQTRPYIQQELIQYKDNLIQIIQMDIKKIINKFKNEADLSRTSIVAVKYKITGFINSASWNLQILKYLNQNINKIKMILGEDWTSTPQGKEINNMCQNFQNSIQKNIDNMIKYCQMKFNNKKDEKIILVRNRIDGDGLEVHVNINHQVRDIVKAVKLLIKWFKEFDKKYIIRFLSNKNAWPSYVATYIIKQSVKTFNEIQFKMNPTMNKLLAKNLIQVYAKMQKLKDFTWYQQQEKGRDDEIIQVFAGDLGLKVNDLNQNVDYIIENQEIIRKLMESIESEEQTKEMQNCIRQIQNIVNSFRKKGFKSLQIYVKELNEQLEKLLVKKLNKIILTWNYELMNFESQDFQLKDHTMIQSTISHEIIVQNQQISVVPPLEHSRKILGQQLQDIIQKICNLNKINNSFMNKNTTNFKYLADTMDVSNMVSAIKSVNSCLERAEVFIQGWKNYQALWELNINKVYDYLGENSNLWEDVLNEIKTGRMNFNKIEGSSQFGPIIISVRNAQRKINNKYESLQNEILNRFGKNFSSELNEFHKEIIIKRSDVEAIDFNDSENIIAGIQELRRVRDQLDKWKNQIDRFRSGEQLLREQRYQFPINWKDFYVVESEWERFMQAYNLKQKLYQGEYEKLKERLLTEEETLKGKMKSIESDWKSKKPYSGNLHPNEALEIISDLQRNINQNKNSFDQLNEAKELLELPLLDLTIINSIQEDSENLKEMWEKINECWSKIDKIMETPVKVANPTKFSGIYDQLGDDLNNLPNKFRTYEALVAKKNKIQEYKKVNRFFKDLKSEAIKEHHWNQILKKIKLMKKYKNLTIGDLFQHNILKYETILNDIIASAQGELVLETMLKNIKDFWNYEEFDLARYQEKCMLIRGWEDMMTKIEDDIAQISSMKLSQFYKIFEEEIKSWNEKLEMLQEILDIWMNVQKKWVYLEGIFFGSSDISQQLPKEYSKFRSINNDFTSLMKKTANRKKILDTCLNIPNLQKSLILLYDLLEKIQKALSDYLETQRQAFARFYFVGDEDLLEIIGNSKTVVNIQKFFNKMFAGINYILNDEGTILKGMRSREGEEVTFSNPFNITEYKKINEWLDQLEYQMQHSLAEHFEKGIKDWSVQTESNIKNLVDKYCAQDVLLSFQTFWTHQIESGKFDEILNKILSILDFMAEAVLTDLPKLTRSKMEQLITEFVHKRDTTRRIQKDGRSPSEQFYWFSQMKYFTNEDVEEAKDRLIVHLGNSRFMYGYEYLGVAEKLVQTPLTDKCYFTLTQALWLRMGGAPFGPAGTGKTESVKMLGATLGRFVLVFNCDETFNFKAMGRIFIGLCQVGAWGCFDEFNRLEERILSAVSQQILTIQMGLRNKLDKIDLMGREVRLNVNMGIFVTMNPGYAGRSNLPENLKQLFRQMAMIKPDRELIAQVMLFSQGFKSAESLSGKVVSLFELCADQLSSQPHYDFGLRALKSVLNSAGSLKRMAITKNAEKANQPIEEQKIILRSFCDTVVPKLISDDAPLLESLIKGVFPEADIPKIEDLKLREALGQQCKDRNLLETDKFIEKILQLNQILKLQHGVMLVGPTGCGKSAAWKVLLNSLTTVDGVKGESYIIDPKAITKDELYGKLDDTTMDWTDGIFTHILRKINENAKGESQKRHWIIFDGDVDPEWVENLNSVLDDNKLLTLPNGERISIPSNVKIMFEVESLKYATLATVSRCGMVWFSNDVLTQIEIFYHYILRLKQNKFDDQINKQQGNYNEVREKCVNTIEPLFFGGYLDQILQNNKLQVDLEKSFVFQSLKISHRLEHVMVFTDIRVLEALFTLIRKGIERVLEYQQSYPDFYQEESMRKFISKWVLIAICWSFSGDTKLKKRYNYYELLQKEQNQNLSQIDLPPLINDSITLIDYTVDLKTGEWVKWTDKIPSMEVDSKDVNNANTIITTVDTLRHQEILCSWLLEMRPFIICGPPGSGKTMTLMSTLRSLPNYDMIFVNFSSSTTPAMILKQFEHYCEYNKTTKGITLKPKQINKYLVVFCDEINLPDEDKYGTQYIITFLRQLTEQKGFWKHPDHVWVKLERIQFVGACNPPTDAGRHPMSDRFMRHCPLMLVDFPGYDSLMQIYGTFNKGMLSPYPELKNHWLDLTKAMVEYYSQSQVRFTSDQQAHYIYSPRELTRWKYAIFEGLPSVKNMDDMVRLWAHEALRLFEDRLVTEEEKEWCQEHLDKIAKEQFSNINFDEALHRPILFSTYLTKNYQTVEIQELRDYIIAKLKQFNEEEYEIQLVVFDSVLDHIVRIDRVLRQPIGHMLLVGASGVGKTTLSRFVSWMNGLKVFQIKAGRNFTLADFDQNLRDVMKRAGCQQEKITFIFDESNVLGVAFLERMNALLASGEVPGLFEGEEYMSLINQYKEHQGKNTRVESDEEIYANFTKNVQRNLHVVFTMNPANPDFSNRAASSPAIFNRCVIDWFGDWSDDALHQVALELTENIEIPEGSLTVDEDIKKVMENLIVQIHHSVCALNEQLKKSAKKFNYMTPRDYLDFIRHFITLHREKKEILEEQQIHLNKGLQQLQQTEQKVQELDESLKEFKIQLGKSNKEAKDKMEMMSEAQSKAEKKQVELEELQVVLKNKKVEIKERSSLVQNELASAGPALESAQKAVKSINKKQLGTIKSLRNPPKRIKDTLEAVCYFIYGKKYKWGEIIKLMMSSSFIKDVMNVNVDKVKKKVKKKVREEYTNSDDWDCDKTKKAFKPAGTLAVWLESVLNYADILGRTEPMRMEIKNLEDQETELVEQSENNEKTLKEIEEKIILYKKDYKILIGKVNKIKMDMKKVNQKVEKSKKLLTNLSSEKERWTETSKGFSEQLESMTGDVLLSSAFLAYAGFFDQLYRNLLLKTWQGYLNNQTLKYKQDLSIAEFLSTASERMIWKSHKLPDDDICKQNAIIMKRFNRYPLVIDPSGQAKQFITSYFSDKKIEQTDFQDPQFMKILEKCLRFGLPVLLRNTEKVDPIMNSVLNKEVVRQGGRILVRIGDQEIDFNKNFLMFMHTKNSEAKFTPDLCSRVTFVNFTVTQSSLQNQCINMYLKNERPDIEKKRLDLLKLQGEFILKLRNLEDDLLNKISEQTGNILENEPLLKTLENIKVQAIDIKKKMEEQEIVLKEVEETTNSYEEIAFLSAKIYFTLQQFSEINKFYQFSFQFYMQILKGILKNNEKLKSIDKKNYDSRIEVIKEEIFIQVYRKIENALLTKDKLICGVKMVQLKLGIKYEDYFKLMFEPCKIIESSWSGILDGVVSSRQLILLENLSKNSEFKELKKSLHQDSSSWTDFVQNRDQRVFPTDWYQTEDLQSEKLIQILICNILKPSQSFELIDQLINEVMTKEFAKAQILDIQELISVDASAKNPVFFTSAPGFDPSGKIETICKKQGKKYTSIAIGSAEGFALAAKGLDRCFKTGSWIMFKNVHLACSWLKEVEQKIIKNKPHKDFRVFLISEFNEKLPVTLIRMSAKALFELPDGIKQNVFRTLNSVMNEEKMNKEPPFRCQIYFQVIWLHAVIMERLRYTPIGWSKRYEFSEADLKSSIEIIDQFLEKGGDPLKNLLPLRSIISNNVYGGKIDNKFDLKILDSLVYQYLNDKFFDNPQGHYLVADGSDVIVEGFKANSYNEVQEWIKNLEIQETPLWAGLPVSAEDVLKRQNLDNFLLKMVFVQDVNQEQIDEIKDKDEALESQSQLKWLQELKERCNVYLRLLPDDLKLLVRTKINIENPLFRFLEREVTVCHHLLNNVRKILKDLILMVEGTLQPLQYLKNLAQTIYQGKVPKEWNKYVFIQKYDVSIWIQDFKNRLDQLKKFCRVNNWQRKGVNVGLMLFPEAFLTASRQFVAQNLKTSLDSLELRISLTNSDEVSENAFLVTGMNIEGVNWIGTQLRTETQISFGLEKVCFEWTQVQPGTLKTLKEGEIFVPLYLNNQRQNLLTSIKFDIASSSLNENLLYQRGIAFIAWNL